MVTGRHTYISADTNITAPIVVGNFTTIARGVEMHNFPQHASALDLDNEVVCNFSMDKLGDFPHAKATEKPITIGNDVWIGTGAVLLDGVTIGDGAIVGAYAVVKKDVEPYAIVVGNPAKVKGYRFRGDQALALLKIKWWEWSNSEIKERVEDFKDIETFIEKYE